jgi:hypothetical protein
LHGGCQYHCVGLYGSRSRTEDAEKKSEDARENRRERLKEINRNERRRVGIKLRRKRTVGGGETEHKKCEEC